ncbi:prolyl aminopeptidase [Falsihalocynthiibacter sp. S25ZX9]|uniref:prolyl aminopeptidase n=1 Tax=Falsihalocynthiibacter sp. S25ZX9 TaxID=3240870 RepID=UPI00350EB99E
MDRISGQNSASDYLFPPIEPFHRQKLDVGDGHEIYVEQCGNPVGVPVVVLHGGPGGGCSPMMRRFFDPSVYRIILFDQRGCGRSRPFASVENNTTWDLVSDMEKIRTALGISRWIVFGGSWGATLALIYAQTHPQSAAYLVLRGVYLSTQRELDWFYGGGAARFYPEAWDAFERIIPEDERGDMIAAYHRRLFGEDIAVQTKYAQEWAAWENSLATIRSNGTSGGAPGEYARAFARLENHYFMNKGFLEIDGQIERDLSKIDHIGVSIVQGRQDMVCPPEAAQRIAARLPKCELTMVAMAGHAMSEPEITRALTRVMHGLGPQKAMLGL